jgi:hypothetical protein
LYPEQLASTSCATRLVYVDPPAHAVVLLVDERSQFQTLDSPPAWPRKTRRTGKYPSLQTARNCHAFRDRGPVAEQFIPGIRFGYPSRHVRKKFLITRNVSQF